MLFFQGMKVSCTHFQCAAWAFTQLRDCYSSAYSPDMSDDVLTFQLNLMLVGHIGGLVQDCSNSSALAMELLQSCTKPSIYRVADKIKLSVPGRPYFEMFYWWVSARNM